MKRLYDGVVVDHLTNYAQMIFLSGPRQVGKTVIAKQCHSFSKDFKYVNWDKKEDKDNIMAGYKEAIEGLPTDAIMPDLPIVVFDEIHKYENWKNYLKGFIDEYKSKLHVIVTGSAKLNVIRRGGDSLMGRYFPYRVHPFSVAEVLRPVCPDNQYSAPMAIEEDVFDALYTFGGFPEPFIKQEKRFYNRWQNLRLEQMLREDIKELSQLQVLSQLEVLASLLRYQAGQLTKYSKLSKKVRVADTTIRRWVKVLENFFYCFTIKPWSKNVARSLLKEPKIYLWDWSVVEDPGGKLENFVASHLLKAVHFWTDMGFGKYELYFLRDKEQREVDFLISKDEKPWMLIEVKSSYKCGLSKNLLHFQKQLKAPHVLQLALDLPYVDKDCFAIKEPKIVSLKAFLSQLL